MPSESGTSEHAFEADDQFGRRDVERTRQPPQYGDGRDVDAALDLADVGPIEPGLQGQELLGPALSAELTENAAEAACYTIRHELLFLQLFEGSIDEEVGADIEPAATLRITDRVG